MIDERCLGSVASSCRSWCVVVSADHPLVILSVTSQMSSSPGIVCIALVVSGASYLHFFAVCIPQERLQSVRMGWNDRGRCRNGRSLSSFPERIPEHVAQIYAGLTFRISISFPSNYPYTAPAIKFDTPCYHPNVDIQSGAICLDILQARILPNPVVLVLKLELGQVVCRLQRANRPLIIAVVAGRWVSMLLVRSRRD